MTIFKEHQDRVAALQSAIRNRKGPFSLKKHAPSNTMRRGEYKKDLSNIDVSGFKNIIHLNTKDKWIAVEPLVTMKQLSQYTLPYNLVCPVIPEFASITVGGALVGTALESSSYLHGQFNDQVVECEVILGDGTKQIISSTKNSDLFYALPGSFGTLALLTLIRLKLIFSRPYVRLHYRRFSQPNQLIEYLKNTTAEFKEGIVLSRNWSVGITGDFAEKEHSLPLFCQKYYWNPWYYQHVCKVTKNGSHTDQMPISDYLFRLDRGAFWMGRLLNSFSSMIRLLASINLKGMGGILRKQAFELKPESNPSFLFRVLFGWALSSQHLYKILHLIPESTSKQLLFVQDFYVPAQKALEVLLHFINRTEIFPLWLCPVRGAKTPQFLSPHFGHELFINIGLYGIPKTNLSIPHLTAELEEEILKYGGRKMLYAMTYYDEKKFSKIYDMKRYDLLRKHYRADKAFLPLYNKIASVL